MVKQDSSALVEAAAAFEAELDSYARLGELFVKTTLGSVKHLERANTTLQEIAACEGRLQGAGQRLVGALAAARGAQEELAKAVVAQVPKVHERNQQLQALMAELAALAGEVGALNATIGQRTAEPQQARDLATDVMGLSDRAATLAERAREAEFEELSTQAHALHQKLVVIGKKLAAAGGN
jgi:hypothetical protein